MTPGIATAADEEETHALPAFSDSSSMAGGLALRHQHPERRVSFPAYVATSVLTNVLTEPPDKAEAEWRRAVDAQLQSLGDLEPGWDSYGAPTIGAGAIANARRLAARMARPPVPAPSAVPTINGTVQLEWHTESYDAEVEALENGRYYVFMKVVGAQPWEGEAEEAEVNERLEQLLFS